MVVHVLPLSDDNFCTDVLRHYLSQALSLLSVNISHNASICYDGGKALGEALKNNSKITSVDISHCNVGDEGESSMPIVMKKKPRPPRPPSFHCAFPQYPPHLPINFSLQVSYP